MYFYLIFSLALFSRLFMFQSIPDGINCDEAYTGYEAFSVLTTSYDSWGKKFPIYFIVGGGGANVLYSYISMLFITILGLETWVIRIPQVIFSLLSVYCYYKLVKLIYDKKHAYIGLFIIAIMPWHIIASRWGFHGNLAPAFILFAFYYFCKSSKKIQNIWLSMLLWGLGCYTYDPTIGFILGIVPVLIIYLLLYTEKKDRVFWYNLIGSCIFFTLIITPLILLWLINQFNLDEINCKYFSIPKLPGWRGNEINFTNFDTNISVLFNILKTQTDNMIWNTINQFGLFYHISTPFMILGIYSLCKEGKAELKSKKFSYKVCILLLFFWGIFYATMFKAYSSNNINFLFFTLTIFITNGIYCFSKNKKIFMPVIGIFALSFINFERIYFTEYNTLAKNNFSIGFKEALKEANIQHQQTQKDIHVLQQNSEASKILFYEKIDNFEYKKTVKWINYPSSYLYSSSFLHYKFYYPYDNITINEKNIYIAPRYTRSFFINSLKNKKYQIKAFGEYIVVF